MRPSRRSQSAERVTLTSSASAELARCAEEGDTTAVMPWDILATLVQRARPEDTGEQAPRFEIVELAPEDAVLIEDGDPPPST